VGGISDLQEWRTLGMSAAILAILGVVIGMCGRALNMMAISDDLAERLGVPVARYRTGLFLGASLLTAVAVSISGPIGFVGLIVPHVLRMLIGPDHRLLLPAAALVGGAFLILADALASVIWRVPLPVGLLTAFIGAPFFVILMKTRDLGRVNHGL
jgi:iron complex transport system permease protein